MNLFRLLLELQKHKASISITERNTLAVDYQNDLTDEIRSAIKQHKPRLFEIFSPCHHCGERLKLKVSPTWFEARCPVEPFHFLIEEHEHSFGHSAMGDYLRSILSDIKFSPEDWLKMQSEIEREALILQNELGISQDEAIVRAKEIIVEKFLAAAGTVKGQARMARLEKKKKKKVKSDLVLF